MAYRIEGGTPAAPVTTTFSLPLADTPGASGAKVFVANAYDGTVLTATGAGWTDGALALSAFPYDARVLSGSATGTRAAITANTTDTVNLAGRDLAALGLSAGTEGDSLELVPVDTLETLFANDLFDGGASADTADGVTVKHLGAAGGAYYYDTTAEQWVEALAPTTPASDIRLSPEGMVAVTRRGPALTFYVTGRVASTDLNFPVANSGVTYTHVGFPVDKTLGELGLDTAIAGWVSDANPDLADLVGVSVGAGWVYYYHDGSAWRRTVGAASDRGSVVVPAGKPLQILRRGATAGTSSLVLSNPVSS